MAQKYIEESVPTSLYEIFSPLIVLGASIGSIFAFSLGFLLPDENSDDDKLRDSNRWRIMYAYFPISIYLILLLGLFTIVKYDTVKFVIRSN